MLEELYREEHPCSLAKLILVLLEIPRSLSLENCKELFLKIQGEVFRETIIHHLLIISWDLLLFKVKSLDLPHCTNSFLWSFQKIFLIEMDATRDIH